MGVFADKFKSKMVTRPKKTVSKVNTKKYQAVLYLWVHNFNGKMYLGYHKTTEIADGYITSSTDSSLLNEWSHGNMKRYILWKGTVEECITLENWALKHAKEYLNWEQFYNQSVGGGEGCRSFDTLTKEMKTVVLDAIEFQKYPEPEALDLYETFDPKLVSKIKNDIKNGLYKSVLMSVIEVFNYERIQVRLREIFEEKVQEITERMIDDPAAARKQIEPVIVVVYPDGRKKLVDGNHTINAAKRAKWQEVNVIYINFSDFNFTQANVNIAFGLEMNHQEKIKTGNSPEDCQRAIVQMYKDIVDKGEKIDLKDENDYNRFKETCKKQLTANKWWTAQRVAKNYERAVIRILTNIVHADKNFITYSKTDKDRIEKRYKEQNPDVSIIGISSGSLYNAGLGAILNKITNENNKKGLIITHHAHILDWEKREVYENQFYRNIANTVKEGITIEIEELPCFAA